MSESNTAPVGSAGGGESADVISPDMRRKLYPTFALSAFGITVVAGTAAIWLPDISDQVNATSVLLLGAIGTLSGALGFAYRPSK